MIVASPSVLVNAEPDEGENAPKLVINVTARFTTGASPSITFAVTVTGKAPVTVVSEILKVIVIDSSTTTSVVSVLDSPPSPLPPQPLSAINKTQKIKR